MYFTTISYDNAYTKQAIFQRYVPIANKVFNTKSCTV